MTHGTRASYVKGCHCDACRAANARYAKLAKYRQDTGRTVMVDAAPVKRHLAKLRAAGVGKRTIARQAGVSQTVVDRLLGLNSDRPAQRIRPETAERLLAVTTKQLAAGAYIDATGTTRRLQALVAIGHTQSSLAARIGWTTANLNVIVLGRRDSVTVATAQLIAQLYDELSMTPGPSNRSRRLAASHRWLPPLAWDDDLIDIPAHEAREHARTSDRARLTIDDVTELLELGETTDGIAARFGVTRSAVEQILSRARREAS